MTDFLLKTGKVRKQGNKIFKMLREGRLSTQNSKYTKKKPSKIKFKRHFQADKG